MFYLAILLTVLGLFLFGWAQTHPRAGWHYFIDSSAGILWLGGVVLAFISLGWVKGLIFLVVTFIIASFFVKK